MSRCSGVRCRKIVYMFMCDSVCCSDDEKVHITNKKQKKYIMHGTRDNQKSLYMVPLKPEQNENMTELKMPERHFSGS